MATKKLVIVKGRGTDKERRIVTNITLYWSETLQRWVTIPSAFEQGLLVGLTLPVLKGMNDGSR